MENKTKLIITGIVLTLSIFSLLGYSVFSSNNKELTDYTHLNQEHNLKIPFSSEEKPEMELSQEILEIEKDFPITIQESKVSYEHSVRNVKLQANPHTRIGSGWVEYEIITDYTGDMIIAFGWDSDVTPTKIQYYDDSLIDIEHHYFDNKTERNVTETTQRVKGWTNIEQNFNRFDDRKFNLKDRFDHTTLSITSGELKKVRVWLDVQEEGKYDLIIYPASYGTDLESAYTSNYFFILDPWVTQAELLDGLIGYWKFDEGSGTTLSDSHGDNDGTLSNADLWDTDTDMGNSIRFVRKDNENIDLGASLIPANDDFTVSLWFRPIDPGVNENTPGILFAQWEHDHANAFVPEYRPIYEGIYSYYIGIGGHIGGLSFSTNRDEDLIHYVLTRSGNTWTVYYNNDPKKTTSIDKTIHNVNTIIGNLDSTGDYNFNPNAYMGQVGIWDRALSSAEIETLYYNGTGIQYPFSELLLITITDIYCYNGTDWKDSFLWGEEIQQCRANITEGIDYATLTLTNETTTQVDNLTNTSYVEGLHYWNFTNIEVLGDETWNVSVSAYHNTETIQNSTSWTVVSPIPLITFNSQTPAQITTFNIFSQDKVLNYTITSFDGINPDTVRAYYKTNTSTSDIFYYVNGVTFEGFQTGGEIVTNYTNDYLISLSENLVYPGAYNFPEGLMVSYPKETYNLNAVNQMVKVELFNVSNNKEYGLLEFYVDNTTATTNALRVYYCNESYGNGNVLNDPNCALSATVLATDTFNHTHGLLSKHYLTSFPVNTTSGETTGGIKVTQTSYFILRGVSQGSWDVYYITNVTRPNAVQTSANMGSAWTNLDGTVDLHLHQYDDTDMFHYYLCANSTTDIERCSAVVSEEIEFVPLPPSPAIIFEPSEPYYFNYMEINYTASTSPQSSPVWYNITLLDYNQDYVLTIVSNNSDNLSYAWDIVNVPFGEYFVQVQSCDNISLCSISLSKNFTIYSLSVQNLQIESTSSFNYSNGSLTLTFDYENNLSIPYVMEEVKWYLNGTIDNSLTNLTYIDEGNFTTNFDVFAEVRVNDGFYWSLYNNVTFTINNFVPTVPDIYSPNYNDLVTELTVRLICTNSTDIDTADTLYYVFRGNYTDWESIDFYRNLTDFINQTYVLQNSTSNYYDLDLTQNGTYMWSCQAHDGKDSSRFATFNDSDDLMIQPAMFWIDTARVYNVTSSQRDTIFSGVTETYKVNITYNHATVQNVLGTTLTWKGVNYTGTLVDDDWLYQTANYSNRNKYPQKLAQFSTSFQIPVLEDDSVVNGTWEVRSLLMNGSVQHDYVEFNQTLTGLKFYDCTGLAANETTIKVMSVYMRDEKNESLTNMDFEAHFITWVADEPSDQNRTYEIKVTDTNFFEFCIYPNNSYKVNSQFKYYSDFYVNRDYYLNNYLLTNETLNLTLYSLEIGNSLGVTLTLLDVNERELEGHYIYIQRYDVTSNSYKLVGMARTDDEGQDYIYLEPFDYWYNFIIIDDKWETLRTTNPQKINENVLLLRTADVTYSELSKKIKNIAYSLTYNEGTQHVLLTYATTTGEIARGCLKTLKVTPLKSEYVCHECSSFASSTLMCYIGDENATYISTFYVEASPKQVIATLTTHLKSITSFTQELGKGGLFLSIMLVTTLGFTGAIFGAWAAVGFSFIAVIVLSFTGILNIGYGAVLGLGLIAGLIISKMRVE